MVFFMTDPVPHFNYEWALFCMPSNTILLVALKTNVTCDVVRQQF